MHANWFTWEKKFLGRNLIYLLSFYLFLTFPQRIIAKDINFTLFLFFSNFEFWMICWNYLWQVFNLTLFFSNCKINQNNDDKKYAIWLLQTAVSKSTEWALRDWLIRLLSAPPMRINVSKKSVLMKYFSDDLFSWKRLQVWDIWWLWTQWTTHKRTTKLPLVPLSLSVFCYSFSHPSDTTTAKFTYFYCGCVKCVTPYNCNCIIIKDGIKYVCYWTKHTSMGGPVNFVYSLHYFHVLYISFVYDFCFQKFSCHM